MVDPYQEYPHHSDPDLFREALAFTEAATGFQAVMIEKDYYCSLVLAALFRDSTALIFKGGTCLSKVYTDFYRLSEDLDFIIPVSTSTLRNQRRAQAKSIKEQFRRLPQQIPGLTITENLIAHNKNQQYIGTLIYSSVVIEKTEAIKIAICSARGRLLTI